MSIHIKEVSKRFGKFQALDAVNVDVPTGQLVALLGPSGSGKTTLLRIIAGLENPDSGSVLIQDEDVTRHSARDRNIGFVFQHYALFRHMTVFENIAFGLRVRHRPEGQVRDRVGELLRLIRLEGLGQRYPGQLSGGQRQRVALARALAAQPRLLLLDEPFGALDAKVRQELRDWLRRLHDEIHVTSLFVTHDQEEAFAVADRVVVMNQGRIEQIGAPHEVFDHPANAFVMDFLGNVNVFPGRVQHGKVLLGDIDLSSIETAAGVRPFVPDQIRVRTEGSLTTSPPSASVGTTVAEMVSEPSTARIYVRPHELDILATPNGVPSLKATVQHLNPAGAVTRVQLLADDFGIVLQVEVSHERRQELALQNGDRVFVSPRKVRVFPDYSI